MLFINNNNNNNRKSSRWNERCYLLHLKCEIFNTQFFGNTHTHTHIDTERDNLIFDIDKDTTIAMRAI